MYGHLCPEKSRLLSEYQKAVHIYSTAVSTVSMSVENSPDRSRYKELTQASDIARNASDVAREQLDKHVGEHRC
jgi:hypothetical protein